MEWRIVGTGVSGHSFVGLEGGEGEQVRSIIFLMPDAALLSSSFPFPTH